MSDKAIGSNGVALVREFVESRLGDDANQNLAVLSVINSLSDKPLNGQGLAVLRDWINAKIAAIPVGPDLDESTADATAVASDISDGKTAYVKGVKVTGTLPDVVGVNLYQSGSILSGIGDIPNGSGGSDFVNRTTIAGTMTDDRILREGARVSIVTASSLFGDADPSDVLAGKTFTAKDGKETGVIATKSASDLTASGATVTAPAGYYPSAASKSVTTATQATPSVSIDNATGLVTASATQTAGYVSAGTKSGTLQLSTQAAATITPGTSDKTAVAANKWTTGAVTVAGDADLVAANIKSGVNIFGVDGSLTPGVDTSDATAAAGDIASGKTAYVASGKVLGNVTTVESGGSFNVTNFGTAATKQFDNSTMIGVSAAMPAARLLRSGSTVSIYAYGSNFGTLSPEDAASGAGAFTSSSGLKVAGTATRITSGNTSTSTGCVPSKATSTTIGLSKTYDSSILFKANSTVKLTAPMSEFGDATAADVASGKTFTSSAGLKAIGTLEGSGSMDFTGEKKIGTITINGSVYDVYFVLYNSVYLTNVNEGNPATIYTINYNASNVVPLMIIGSSISSFNHDLSAYWYVKSNKYTLETITAFNGNVSIMYALKQ